VTERADRNQVICAVEAIVPSNTGVGDTRDRQHMQVRRQAMQLVQTLHVAMLKTHMQVRSHTKLWGWKDPPNMHADVNGRNGCSGHLLVSF
jgi:hypothetical protein